MTAEYLRTWFERVEKSRAEKKQLTAHERDLFTEADGNGFDKKALRKVLARRAMGDAECMEQDSLVDAYEAALGGKALAAELMRKGASVRQAAAKAGIGYGTARRAKNKISGSPPHDPATGEITQTDRADDDGAPQAASGEGDAAAAAPVPESTAGSISPPSAGNDAPHPSSAVASPAVEPDYLADAAANYTEAVGAIRAGIVERGEARHLTDGEQQAMHKALRDSTKLVAVGVPVAADAGDIPAFLDRRQH